MTAMLYFKGESELRMAMRHAHEGRAAISHQQKLIAKMRERGLPTRHAEDVLAWMVKTQWVLEEDYEKVRQRLLAYLEPPVTPLRLTYRSRDGRRGMAGNFSRSRW
jgi:hypothetical protein